ncbi:MAG: hypothetical protein UT42_C0001G0016 [Candidatus Falkowbacteria bacterium GW2011_GWA2_39_24]|uniref:GIY-YIG domain-containing protein n=1 Tax=Candidatus Falkowbacteria bacterium GW2011_GWA2_39_24 TaxID=1618634 RepID=A0A0G0NH36_9BACT|nr:MAG: hypothetical protein UT42_C0001G0016 [Candidatus Falkowbacteria bacterium GW2011_GWA2_39_24]
MKPILKESKEIAQALLKETPRFEPKIIPETQGVYLIYKRKKIIYVGKGKNLQKRIAKDHLSVGVRGIKSAFQRKVHRIYEIPFGLQMKKWISRNCKFTYKAIKDADMCSLVESLLITYLRSNGQKLLNS